MGFEKRPRGDWDGNEQQPIRFMNMHVCPQELFACVLKGRKSRELEMFMFCLWNEFTVFVMYLSMKFIRNNSYLTSLPMCGFIAQLVEHRTGITEVTGSNPVEALIFFRLLLSNCLNWKIYCDGHSSLSYLSIFFFSVYKTELELKLLENLAQILQ